MTHDIDLRYWECHEDSDFNLIAISSIGRPWSNSTVPPLVLMHHCRDGRVFIHMQQFDQILVGPYTCGNNILHVDPSWWVSQMVPPFLLRCISLVHMDAKCKSIDSAHLTECIKEMSQWLQDMHKDEKTLDTFKISSMSRFDCEVNCWS